MKFHEFGKENEKTLVLLHGVDTTWKISFGKFIELAQSVKHLLNCKGYGQRDVRAFEENDRQSEKV